MKRIEIITAAQNTEKIQRILDQNDMKGYSFFKRVAGKGSQGYMDADGLSMAFQNVYFLIGCSAEQYEKLKTPLQHLLNDIGGVAMVSDAEWIRE